MLFDASPLTWLLDDYECIMLCNVMNQFRCRQIVSDLLTRLLQETKRTLRVQTFETNAYSPKLIS